MTQSLASVVLSPPQISKAPAWHETTWLAGALTRVNKQIRSMCAGCEALEEEIAYATLGPGKRIRAGLLLSWRAIAFGDTNSDETAERAAAAIELIHEASLIHDDVCDNSAYRRGRSSVAARFGIPRATLAGAVLSGRGIAELAAICEREGIELDLETLRCLVKGQILESLAGRTPYFEGAHPYFGIICSKTGSLFRLACALGADLGARYREPFDLAAPLAFADSLAIAYQVLDDVLDIEADPLLKPGRGDIAGGVPTWPILEWIASTPTPQIAWERLQQTHKSFLDIQQLHSEIAASGSIEKARSLIQAELETAETFISAFQPGEAVDGLRKLLGFLASR